MPPRHEDEWSDSEDENLSEVETLVLLGVPDGEIEELSDLSDPTVSRIGGLPMFLPSSPLPSSGSHCKSCSHPMPLLVQMWCPFEGSPMDRVLYVWGCSRPECQCKAGSVRAWRGLKFNRKYAAKLARKQARDAEKSARMAAESAMKAEEKRRQSINPFSTGGAAQKTFGLGTRLFGGDNLSDDPGGDIQDEKESVSEEDSAEETSGDSEVDSVAKQLGSISFQTSTVLPDGVSSPSYKPVYLSTVSEYLPPLKSKKQLQDLTVDDDTENNKKTSKDWGLEGWEASADVDPIFDRFVRRVSNESDQCVRYFLKGTPLPFGSRDAVYDLLFPASPSAAFTTRPGVATPLSRRRTFDSSAIDKCDACGGRRVFECQLMPNLINVLREHEKGMSEGGENEERKKESSQHQSEEDRKRELEGAMKTGIQWGTCFVFSCVGDCYVEESEGWKEELVLVQWDV